MVDACPYSSTGASGRGVISGMQGMLAPSPAVTVSTGPTTPVQPGGASGGVKLNERIVQGGSGAQ